MTKPPNQWDQNLPPWVRAETQKTRKAPVKGASPAPKPAPKPEPPKFEAKPAAKPKPHRLHVRIIMGGGSAFVLDGDQAAELGKMLERGATAEDVLEYLDPQASGIKLVQAISILQEPMLPGWPYDSWTVTELAGQVERDHNGGMFSPFHRLPNGKQAVAWDQVEKGGTLSMDRPTS